MSGVTDIVQGLGSGVLNKGQALLDQFFPPEKRSELMARLQSFAASNPKLAAFLLTNVAITGFPLFMFGVFTLTVFVFAIIAGLLIALLVALAVTLFAVIAALFIVLPTTFLTTMAASFIFLWGLGGYYLLKWFNKGGSPAPEGSAIGDKLDQITGGRMGWLMDSVRQQDKDGKSEHKDGEKRTPQKIKGGQPKKHAAGGLPDVGKTANVGNATDTVKKTADVNGVASKATGVAGGAGGATGSLGNVTSTAAGAKGAVGGATGLV